MADQRITQLTQLTKASVAATDVLPVVDLSASETKKVTAKDLVAAGIDLVDPGEIDLSKLNQASTTKLGTSALADDSITAAKLANDSSVAVQTTAPTADNFEGRGYFNTTTGNVQVFNGTAYQQVVMPTAGIGDLQVTTGKLADGISALAALPQASLQANADVLAVVDISGSETKKITAKELFQGAAQQADPNSVPISVLDTSAGIPGHDVNFTQGDVLLGRDGTGAGQGLEIPCTQAGRDVLAAASAAAQRVALGLGTISTANGTWVDGSSVNGTHSGVNTGDQTISLSGVVLGSGTGAITTTFGAGTVDTAALADGAVTAVKIADDSISATKLADDSSTVVAPGAPVGTGAFIGQLQANSADSHLYYYNGTGWSQVAGFTSLSFLGSTPITWSVSFPVDQYSPVLNATLDLQPPRTVWAGPATGTASVAPTFRALTGGDLPAPTGIEKGGVYQGEGTLIEADGQLHLAPATDTLLGGVSVNDANLNVSIAGGLQHTSSPQAAGTYTKVTTDARGHVVGAAALDAPDIPILPASKIVGGTFAPALFAGKSITREALADYAISYIQEDNPGLVTDHIGCLWLQESSGQLRMWNGNSWYPVGFGRLSEENLRFCGTFDAQHHTVPNVTTFGTAAGIAPNAAIPAATNELTGAYLVVSSPGTYAGTAYDNGDWILCLGLAEGWVRVDTLSSGGGGGGAQNLDGLLDVTLTAPVANQVLTFNGPLARWENRTLTAASETAAGIAELATQAEVDAGTDDARIITPLKLANATLNCGTY